MKVFIPKPNESWICDVIIDEFCQVTRHKIVNNIHDSDVIFLYAKWIWNHFPLQLLKKKPVLMTVHHIVPEKQDPNDFKIYDTFVDHYHVPCTQTAIDIGSYTEKTVSIVPYWFNDNRWHKINVSQDGFIESLRVPPLVIGSFQRDTEGSSIGNGKIPQPKLEKGPDVLLSIIRSMPKGKVGIMIPGWRRDYLIKNLEGYPVFTSEKLPPDQMNRMYNLLREAGGVYLVTSRHEGGPQAILEAAATETPILSTPVGIAADVLHPDCIIEGGPQDFVNKLFSAKNFVDYNLQSVKKLTLNKIVPFYDRLLEVVYEKGSC